MEHGAGPDRTGEVAAWVGSELGEVTSIEQGKVRPWARVWEVVVDGRTYFAKVNCAGQVFEAELVAELARLAPAYVVPVVAVDPRRGLLLTPDQGPVFAETVRGDDLDAWCRLVVRAMELARVTADHGASLLATGLTSSRVPEHVGELVTPWQEELDTLGLPATVVHNDLHEHNAFDRPDGLRLFDFADAVWGHPLSTLLVPLNVLADRLDQAGPQDARLRRVADAALEVWSDRVPAADLRQALPAALRLGRLDRAESWARIEPHLAGDDLGEYGGAAADWLARLEDPVPVRWD